VLKTKPLFGGIAVDRAGQSFLSAPMLHRYEVLHALVFDGDSETREKNVEFEASKNLGTVMMVHYLSMER